MPIGSSTGAAARLELCGAVRLCAATDAEDVAEVPADDAAYYSAHFRYLCSTDGITGADTRALCYRYMDSTELCTSEYCD